MKQDVWRGLPYYDVFWHKRHLTRRELHAIRANYQSYIYWFLVVSLFVLLDLHGFAARVSVAALVVYTVSLLFLTIMLYFFITLLGLKISRKYSWFFLVYPVVGFFAVTVATYATEAGMSMVFGNGLSLSRAAEKLPVNILLGLLLETIYLNFVFPVMVADMAPPAPAAPKCTSVTIAGQKFACKDIIAASSQDHYVRIQTRNGAQLIRARLADLIERLDCQNGIQPHRSYWVARQAVTKIVSDKGHKYLELHDGSRIPVARGRQAEVRRWLETGGGE
jgi:hypothetical protein